MNKLCLKTPIRALIFVLVTFLGLSVFGQDSVDFYDQIIYERLTHITPAKVAVWKAETQQLLSKQGVSTERLQSLKLNQLLGLWGMSNHDVLTPDYVALKLKTEYWVGYLGLKNFNTYILQTTHNDPYHLLAMNLESWAALSEFMVTSGFFAQSQNDPKSLYQFLMMTHWGEGVVTSSKTKPELWHGWAMVFKSIPNSKQAVTKAFSVSFYEDENNQDFIQRLYISLTKDLLNVVSRHQNLVSAELLIDFLNPKLGLMHSSFTSDMSDLFKKLDAMLLQNTKIKSLVITESVIQSVIVDLLNAVYINPSLVRKDLELQNTILKLYKKPNTKNMCSGFLQI